MSSFSSASSFIKSPAQVLIPSVAIPSDSSLMASEGPTSNQTIKQDSPSINPANNAHDVHQPCDVFPPATSLSLEQQFESLTMIEVMPQQHRLLSQSMSTILNIPCSRSSNESDVTMGDRDENDDKSLCTEHRAAQTYSSSCTRMRPAMMRQQVSEGTSKIKRYDEEKLPTLRQRMIRLLKHRLQHKCPLPQNSMSQEDDPDRIPKAAKTLEHLLWKSAKDLNVYSDLSTLDERLRGLMTIMVRRKMMCQSAYRQRGEMLQNILGRTRYQRVRDLVRDIRQAKLQKVATLHQCVTPNSKNGNSDVGEGSSTLLSSSSSSSSSSFCGPTLVGSGGSLPSVVRNLYFGTTLVTALETYSPSKFPILDWDILIEEAERNLFEFRRWEESIARRVIQDIVTGI